MNTLASPTLPNDDTAFPRLATRLGTLSAAILLLALALQSVPAHAQSAVPCTAIDNDAQRLACYDRALRPAQPAPPNGATPSRAASEPSPAATESAGGRAARRDVRDATAPAVPAPQPAPAPRSAGSSEEAVVPIVVVGIRALPGREATFTTRDGASWVQTDSQRLPTLPDPPFAAEIRPGSMGSHFLVPSDRGRAIRVRPLR